MLPITPRPANQRVGVPSSTSARSAGANDTQPFTPFAPPARSANSPAAVLPRELEAGASLWREKKQPAAVQGVTMNAVMRFLGVSSVIFALAATSWWTIGPGFSGESGFLVITAAIALALADLVALFVLSTVSTSRPDSRSYMSVLIETQDEVYPSWKGYHPPPSDW